MRRLALLAAAALVAACDTTDPDAGAVTEVLAGTPDGLVTVDVASGAARALPAGGFVRALAVAGDRLVAATDRDGGRVVRLDLRTGAADVDLALGAPRGVALGPGVAYVTSRDSSAVVPVALATGQLGAAIPTVSAPVGAALVGQTLYVAASGDALGADVAVIDTETRTPRFPLAASAGPRTLVVDAADVLWVVCTGRTESGAVVPGAVVAFDGRSGAERARLAAPGLLGTGGLGADAALDRAGGTLYVVDAAVGLRRIDTAARAEREPLALAGAAVTAVAFDDAGGRLYLGRADGTVSVHDRDGAETARYAVGGAPTALAFRRAAP